MKHEISKTTNALMLGRERVRKGWCQGAPSDGKSVCMIRAIASVAEGPTYMQARHALAVACFGRARSGISPILYNDAPGRTKEEVLSKFDEAMAWSMADDVLRG
jgi:hypothetical protein